MGKQEKAKRPIIYFYNPYFRGGSSVAFVEVWQVLDDEVLGKLYPWQYVPSAEMSSRIETLNFIALTNFEVDSKKFPSIDFIYKVSARLLDEGNVQRLAKILAPSLALCFDVYQLEKFGVKNSVMGLKYLKKRGATIIIEGMERAPMDVLGSYPADFFKIDYRYYNERNKGMLAMLKQVADSLDIGLLVSNVNSDDNITIFSDLGLDVYSGPILSKPKRRPDTFAGMTSEGDDDAAEDAGAAQASEEDARLMDAAIAKAAEEIQEPQTAEE